MYTSKKILLICVDIDRSTDAIEQAVELAHINSGNIFVKLIVPDFPKGLSSHHAKYVKYLTERLSLELEKTCEKFGANAHLIIDSIVVHSTQNAPIDIIKQVMLDNIDVVIKQKQPLKNDYGISSFDMGTLARTGIAGFIMGNTSENIVQKVQCSLIAFKPDEFISPVTPN